MDYTVGKDYEEISTALTCSYYERLQTKLIWEESPPPYHKGLSQKYPASGRI